MTPLMLSLIFWRAVHPASVHYPDHTSASVVGSLAKLNEMGAVRIYPHAPHWTYELTSRGYHFVDVVQLLELP